MKKIISGALALFIFGMGAQAQVSDTLKSHHVHRMDGQKQAMKDMNFSADQKAKLKTIHEEQRKEYSSLSSSGLSGDALKEKRKELHKKYRSQADAVYTPEQREKMKKMKATHKMKHGKHKEKEKVTK